MDTTDLRVRLILAAGAAAAHGSPVLGRPEHPCTVCGTASPARQPDECDDPTCPLEGHDRD